MSYQITSSGVILLDGVAPTLSESSRARLDEINKKLQPLISANSRRTGVPASWISAIIWAETGFLGPDKGEVAVSPAGAVGRMQLTSIWWNKPTQIGDGKSHTQGEMMHDTLNIQFGSDLLALIRRDGNDLIATASIYNCGSQSSKHPWRPHPSPPYVGRPAWGLCGEVGADGLSYLDAVAKAANAVPSRPVASPAAGKPWLAAGVTLALLARAAWQR